MKIYLKAYLKKNLGDDLFVKTLLDRYPKHNFYIRSKREYTRVFPKNLKRIKRYILKAFSKLFHDKEIFEKKIQIKTDLTVLIGGSMFMQQNKDILFPIRTIKNDYYILGANFGPYVSEKYLLEAETAFSKMNDICFREKYSYELFSELENVRCAPDILFSIDTTNINIRCERTVIISVIDCSKKSNKEYTEDYEKKIIEFIKFFLEKQYKVILMSFCKDENDEVAIERIKTKCANGIKKKIETYFYNGNMQEALEILAKSEIIVGTRFHANILGLIFNKTIIPIAYSDKTIHVLKDMNFKGKIIQMKEIKNFHIEDLTDDDLTYKMDISFEKKDADRHFEKLDKILMSKKEKNE